MASWLKAARENTPEKQYTQKSGRVVSEQYRPGRLDRQNSDTAVLDAKVQNLKDQLIRAKVYLGLGSSRSNPHFIRELRVRIRDVQRALSDATKDSKLPRK